jgi:hypothetical protein
MAAISAFNSEMARLKTLRDTPSLAVDSTSVVLAAGSPECICSGLPECGVAGPGSSNKRIDRGFARSILDR